MLNVLYLYVNIFFYQPSPNLVSIFNTLVKWCLVLGDRSAGGLAVPLDWDPLGVLLWTPSVSG